MFKSNENVTIVLLAATAVVLTCLLLATYMQTNEPAWAEAATRGGNYIVTTGEWNENLDLIYVINIAARKLNVYYGNSKTRTLDLIETIDLEKVFSQQ